MTYTLRTYGCAEYLRYHGFTTEGEIVFRRPAVPIAAIQREVARHFKIPMREMKSKRRERASARARQVAMYLCREHTPRSLPEIGRLFGGRDHTTVLHGIRKIEQLRVVDADLNNAVTELRSILGSIAQ